jgi:hypothetical protein
MKLKLMRLRKKLRNDPKGIHGLLLINDGTKSKLLKTLENEDYLLDCGFYKLRYEYSPKFKRELWEFKETEPRTEIKFHRGTHSKHSKGCILLGDNELEYLHNTLDSSKIHEIEIL